MKKQAKAHKTPEQIRTGITDKIIAAVEGGTPPWRQPWAIHPNGGSPRNFHSRRRYTGINALLLWLDGEIKGWESQQFGTHDSWMKHVGVHIKKGQHATYVTLFKHMQVKDKATGLPETTPSGKPKTIPLLREFAVFNAEQMVAPAPEVLLAVPHPFGIVRALLQDYSKGGKRTTETTKEELLRIAAKFLPKKTQPADTATREEIAMMIHRGITEKLNSYKCIAVVTNTDPDFEPVERLMDLCGATFKHKGVRAFWNKATDVITLPPKKSFESIATYYQTGMHELVHWTQNPGRVGERARVDGESQYAFNELVADIGSCFVLAELGLPHSEKLLPQTAAYVKSWLAEMKGDPKYIFEAASQASKAADFLLAFVGKANPPYVEEVTDHTEHEEAHRSVS